MVSPCAFHVDSIREGQLRGPQFIQTSAESEGRERAGEGGRPGPSSQRRCRGINQGVNWVGVRSGGEHWGLFDHRVCRLGTVGTGKGGIVGTCWCPQRITREVRHGRVGLMWRNDGGL